MSSTFSQLPRRQTRFASEAAKKYRAPSAFYPSSLILHPSRSPSRHRGVTLIEILAGLAVLGVLIASIMIARGRALRQWADADAKLQASRAVDTLVSTWLAGPEARSPQPSDEYVAFSAMRMAADDA